MPTRFTYSETATQVRSVVDVFDVMSPKEVPFLKLISGGTDEKPSLNSLSIECTASKYEWLDFEDPPLSTTLGANIDNTQTNISVASGTGKNIVEGHILLIGNEQLLVGAWTSDGDTNIPVTRGFAGTTAAAASSGATVTIIGRVHKEGGESPNDRVVYPTNPYNWVQEWTASLALSEMEQAIARYGIDDAIEHETATKTRDLFRIIERHLLWQDKRVQGSGTTPAVCAGLKFFIPSGNTLDVSNNALTTTHVQNLLQTIYTNVGMANMPDTLICGPWVRRKLTSIFAANNQTVYREANNDKVRGGVSVDVVVTDFGPLNIVLSDLINPSDMFVVKTDYLGFGPLRGKEFRREMLAKTGTTDKWMITGNYTFEVRCAKCHGWWRNISTTS